MIRKSNRRRKNTQSWRTSTILLLYLIFFSHSSLCIDSIIRDFSFTFYPDRMKSILEPKRNNQTIKLKKRNREPEPNNRDQTDKLKCSTCGMDAFKIGLLGVFFSYFYLFSIISGFFVSVFHFVFVSTLLNLQLHLQFK